MFKQLAQLASDASNLEPLSGYRTLAGGKQGPLTYEVTAREERLRDVTSIRFQIVNSGSSYSRTCSFAWPVADLQRPVEIVALFEPILAAAAPGAPMHDPRGRFSRWLDRITNVTHINQLDAYIRSVGERPLVASAAIRATKHGTLVHFNYGFHDIQRDQVLLPLDAVRALRDAFAERCHSADEATFSLVAAPSDGSVPPPAGVPV